MFFVLIAIMFVYLPLTSAGFSDWYARITGRVTNSSLSLNVTVSNTPTLPFVWNKSIDVSTGPSEAPTLTTISFNFTAYDADGSADLNDSSAMANVSIVGHTTRQNSSCKQVADFATNYVNYTCIIDMYYWDGSGNWNITAFVKDIEGEKSQNNSAMFYLGATTGFIANQSSLTWASIAAGGTNLQPNEFIRLNNTGNVNISNVAVNATSLLGETNSAKALWAGNFTAKISSGCEGTALAQSVFTQVGSATLPSGNSSANNGNTGQEDIYFCLETTGTELTSQSYSTSGQGVWNIKITA